MPAPDKNTAALMGELGQVKGQLTLITQLMQQHHDATHQRINDLSKAMDTRFTGVEERLSTLERNERGTAMRTAGVAAVSGAIVSAGLAMLRVPH